MKMDLETINAFAKDFAERESVDFRHVLQDFGIRTESRDPMEFVDRIEWLLEEKGQPTEMPVQHKFTPGLYTRTIQMPAGSLLTSQIHKTEHPFVIHSGSISVWTRETGVQLLHAPYLGVTTPGTRRVLYAHTDTVWSTFHPTDKTTVEEVREDIIQNYKNPQLEKQLT